MKNGVFCGALADNRMTHHGGIVRAFYGDRNCVPSTVRTGDSIGIGQVLFITELLNCRVSVIDIVNPVTRLRYKK